MSQPVDRTPLTVRRVPLAQRAKDCPGCGLPWYHPRIETTGEAKHGGGYHRQCNVCGAEWDDVQFSYGELETLRRRAAREAAASPPPGRWRRLARRLWRSS